MFDEYTEEINNSVAYGVLYTHRSMSNRYTRDSITSIDEEKVTLALKINALHCIKEDVMREYAILEEQYNNLIGDDNGSM